MCALTHFGFTQGVWHLLNHLNRIEDKAAAAQSVYHGGKCATAETDSSNSGTDESIYQLQQALRTAEEKPKGD